MISTIHLVVNFFDRWYSCTNFTFLLMVLKNIVASKVFLTTIFLTYISYNGHRHPLDMFEGRTKGYIYRNPIMITWGVILPYSYKFYIYLLIICVDLVLTCNNLVSIYVSLTNYYNLCIGCIITSYKLMSHLVYGHMVIDLPLTF